MRLRSFIIFVLSFVIICFSISGHVGAEEEYCVDLTANKTIVTCGDLIYVFVGSNKDFAATEITPFAPMLKNGSVSSSLPE